MESLMAGFLIDLLHNLIMTFYEPFKMHVRVYKSRTVLD